MQIFIRAFAALVATCAFMGAASAGPVLVVDAATGQVLKAEDATRPWHPASTTKMMTAYLALKAVKSGRLGLETAIPASKLAASQPRVKVYIKPGQEITLDNAMKIMMVKSANDIAYVIAEGVGGTVENFVAMMNAEARRLGMNESLFVNPNGWHHPQQQTSARDLATLAIALMRDFPEYAEYWNIGAVQLGRQNLKNTNGLVGRYSGINGFKTGFVCASGFNVVASATRGGRTLITVVLGALSGSERTVVAAQGLDEGFGSWSGMGYTLASLPGSGYSSATNICAQVRQRGGGAALADDVEVDGPISFQAAAAASSDNGMADRFAVATQAATRSSGTRSAGGRYALSARAELPATPVAFGRTSGTARAPLAANVARKPDAKQPETKLADVDATQPSTLATGGKPRTLSANGAIPMTASAFASTGSGPMKLQGATTGMGSAVPLRSTKAAVAKAKPGDAKTRDAKTKDGKTRDTKTNDSKTLKTAQAKTAKPAVAKTTAKPAAAKAVAAKPQPVPVKPPVDE